MLGEEIQKARKAAEMTQEKLAYRADIDRTYLSQLENNRKSPTVDVLFRLCDAMGLSASKLIARVEKKR